MKIVLFLHSRDGISSGILVRYFFVTDHDMCVPSLPYTGSNTHIRPGSLPLPPGGFEAESGPTCAAAAVETEPTWFDLPPTWGWT